MSRPEPIRAGSRDPIFTAQVLAQQQHLRETRGQDVTLAILTGVAAGVVAGALLGSLLTRDFFEPFAASWNPLGGVIGFAAAALKIPRIYRYLRARRARRFWTG